MHKSIKDLNLCGYNRLQCIHSAFIVITFYDLHLFTFITFLLFYYNTKKHALSFNNKI
jgi:hypothetical protein